jgi:hypothetical protein
MLQPWNVGTIEEQAAQMEEWIRELSEQGGNYFRVWLSSGFWDTEHEKSGVYDEIKAKRIDALIAATRKYNVRIKMTFEHFRYFNSSRNQWAAKPIHHVSQGGPANDIADFFDGEKSRNQFKQKLAWFKNRYGNEPIVYGWELWNEVDCIRDGDYIAWTQIMLNELDRLFPFNLSLQSLGSFDTSSKRDRYRRMSVMKNNDIAQVHRYLDLGARMEICHGPVDVLTADAVRELRSYNPNKPVILAETGAVEPSHSGPFKLYAKDKDGIILHDVLFAPFFAGSAGTGQIWHWDHYVDKNNLWWHFGRFAEAVKGIDPIQENFNPSMIDHKHLRIYALNGNTTTLLWCRDKTNTWFTELEQEEQPQTIKQMTIEKNDIENTKIQSIKAYDPWKNVWSSISANDRSITLPDFKRSLILRIDT